MCAARDEVAPGPRQLLRRRRSLRVPDQRGEVLGPVRALVDVDGAGPADRARGVDPADVRLLGRDDAVRGEQDRAVERAELLTLLLPGRTVLADQVRKRLQLRVGVRGQHLAVGVDVDARVLRLLEELVQVLEVVARDHDPRAGPDRGLHGGDLGGAVGLGVGPVEQGHGRHAHPAALEVEGDHLVDREVVLQGRGKPLLDERLDRAVRVPEHGGVVVVRGHPLEAVDQHPAEGADVLVSGGEHARLGHLRVDIGVGGRRPGGCVGRARPGRRQGVANGHGLPDLPAEDVRVEVDVGDGHEEGVDQEAPRLVAPGSSGLARGEIAVRDPAGDVEQDVLEPGQDLVLATDTADVAARTPDRLLALVTEHSLCTP